MNASLVVPCFNEQQNLPALFSRAERLLPGADVELVVVDNGSTDGSLPLLQAHAAAAGFPVQLVTVPQNRGYGHGVQQGLAAARGELVGWTHADGQVDLSIVLAALQRLRTRSRPERWLVKGQRTGRRPMERLFSVGHSVVAWGLLERGLYLRELNAVPTWLHSACLRHLRHPPLGFQFEVYVLVALQRAGVQVDPMAVPWNDRERGASSWQTGQFSRLRLGTESAAYLWSLRSGR